jgi:hypothetical protein
MNWLARHLDWVFVGIALVLSGVWISNYIVHPITDPPAVAIVDDHYVPSILRTVDRGGTHEDFLKLPPVIPCMKGCNKFCSFAPYRRLKVEKGNAVSQVADEGVSFQEFFTHVSTTGTCAWHE